MKRFWRLAMGAVVALVWLSAPLTAWAEEGTGSSADGANLGALVTLMGVLAILVVGSVYLAWSEPQEEDED